MISDALKYVMSQSPAKQGQQEEDVYAPFMKQVNRHMPIRSEQRDDPYRRYMAKFASMMGQPVPAGTYENSVAGNLARFNSGWAPALEAYDAEKARIEQQNALAFKSAHQMRESQLQREMKRQEHEDLVKHRNASLAEQKRYHDLLKKTQESQIPFEPPSEELKSNMISISSKPLETQKHIYKDAYDYQNKRRPAIEAAIDNLDRMSEIIAGNENLTKGLGGLLKQHNSKGFWSSAANAIGMNALSKKDEADIDEFLQKRAEIKNLLIEGLAGTGIRPSVFMEQLESERVGGKNISAEGWWRVGSALRRNLEILKQKKDAQVNAIERYKSILTPQYLNKTGKDIPSNYYLEKYKHNPKKELSDKELNAMSPEQLKALLQ